MLSLKLALNHSRNSRGSHFGNRRVKYSYNSTAWWALCSSLYHFTLLSYNFSLCVHAFLLLPGRHAPWYLSYKGQLGRPPSPNAFAIKHQHQLHHYKHNQHPLKTPPPPPLPSQASPYPHSNYSLSSPATPHQTASAPFSDSSNPPPC